jgi:hypothetical protein
LGQQIQIVGIWGDCSAQRGQRGQDLAFFDLQLQLTRQGGGCAQMRQRFGLLAIRNGQHGQGAPKGNAKARAVRQLFAKAF